MSRPSLSPAAGLLLVVLLWSGNFTATKVAFTEIEPLAFTAIRFALGTLVIWAILRRIERPTPLPRPLLGKLVILGVLGNSVYQLLFIEGLDRTPATKSALILAVLPVAVTVGAAALGVEHVTRRQKVAVAVASVGVVAVLLARGGSIGGSLGLGELLLMAGVVAWTAYTLMLRAWALPLSPLRLTAWTLYTGTPILVLAGLPQLVRTDWGAVTMIGWGGLFYSAMLSLVVAYVIWNAAVARIGASRTAVFQCLVPFLTAVIAFFVLDERPGPLHVVGGLLIIGGVLLATQGDRDATSTPAPLPE
jgi:drug/metabolite transporter (DMT)-like permease